MWGGITACTFCRLVADVLRRSSAQKDLDVLVANRLAVNQDYCIQFWAPQFRKYRNF